MRIYGPFAWTFYVSCCLAGYWKKGGWYRLPKDEGFRMEGYVGADQIGSSTVEASLRIGPWELGLPVAFPDEKRVRPLSEELKTCCSGWSKA
jgi:hypothetical protein